MAGIPQFGLVLVIEMVLYRESEESLLMSQLSPEEVMAYQVPWQPHPSQSCTLALPSMFAPHSHIFSLQSCIWSQKDLSLSP